MKDKRSLHLKVQELCDCYATTDPLKEMSVLQTDDDKNEAALKWIALAILHGINANAKKISIARSNDGEMKVAAEYQKLTLPNPGSEMGEKVIEALREIAYLGNIKLKREKNGESVILKFPE